MAAPNTTKWGSTVGDYGRLGINVALTTTDTQVKRVVQIWFWSKYSISDTGNTLYYDCGTSITSATTSKGSVSISTSHSSGSGWSTDNQKLLATYTYTYTRGTSATTYKLYSKLTGVDRVGGTMYASTSYTIPALQSYKVSYNANGGSGAPSSQTKYYGKSLTLSSTKPTRSGYTFVGWGTSASDTSWTYKAGGTYSGNSAITLYALWKKTITLTYDANGGSGAPTSQSYTVWNATTNHKFTLSSTKPTRTGYTFLGWSTSSTATSASYSAGGSITLSASTTLYAVWSVITYTVSYNANGGTGAPGNQTKTYGITLILSTTKPTKVGHTFVGWGSSTTATSPTKQPGDSYTSNASCTYYAIWTPNVLTVNYYSNGATSCNKNVAVGTSINAKIETGYYKYNTTYPTGLHDYVGSGAGLAMSKTGYNGTGNWNTATNGTGKSVDATIQYTGQALASAFGKSIDSGNATVNVYPEWVLNVYTITYNANGGSNAPSKQTKGHGVTVKVSSTVPVRDGYRFLGWSTNSTATTPTYQPGANFTTNANTTLYAVWEQLGILHINIEDTWKNGKVWINVDGTWKTGLVYINVNGTWKQGGV